MNQTCVVRTGKTVTQLFQQLELLVDRECSFPGEDLGQCFALDVLHSNERLIVVDTDVIDSDDVLVLKATSGASLPEEASPHFFGIDAK